LTFVESHLASRDPVGELPHCATVGGPQGFSSANPSSGIQPPECTKRPHTLGGLALRAANAITRHDHTLPQLRAWRAQNPDLSRSRSYNGRLFSEQFTRWKRSGVVDADCRLAELRARDAKLFFLACLEDLERAPARDLLEIGRDQIGAERVLAMLRHPAGHGLKATQVRPFAVWVLVHWAELVGACHSDELLALWDEGRLREARGPLAVAASRANPKSRLAILTAAVTETGYARIVAEELAEHYLRTDESALVEFFSKDPGASRAVLAVLRRAGPGKRAVFAALLQKAPLRVDAQVVAIDLFTTAHVLGVPILPCEGRLYDEGSGPLDEDKSGSHRTVTDADRRLGAQRRTQCLARLKAKLRDF
jgi:hypothetical protein